MSISRRNREPRQSSPEHALRRDQRGDTDGVVEGEAEGLVDVLATLAAVEQVLLDVVADGEKGAAGCVVHHVDAVGTGDTADERACNKNQYKLRDYPLGQKTKLRTNRWRLEVPLEQRPKMRRI